MSAGSISLTETKLDAFGFNFFNTEKIPSETFAGWSSNDGLMQSFYEDSQAVKLNPGSIEIPQSEIFAVQF